MGSGTSKTPEDKAQEVLHKLAVVNAMDNRHVKPPAHHHQRHPGGLHDYLQKRKAEKEMEEVLEDDTRDTGRTIFGETTEEREQREREEKLYEVPAEPAVEATCGQCGQTTMYRIDGYMCRVCGTVFHKPCLAKTGRYTEAEMAMIDRAFTTIGWSCHDCDNITSMLTNDESAAISNTFEEFDINKDCAVSVDEYLAYRRKQYKQLEGSDMPQDEEAFERIQFSLLDADGSGEVDYWEFMKHEATKVLLRREKEELVRLLTAREKLAARMLYDHMDADKDGTIDAVEARRAFRTWYSFADDINSKASKDTGGAPLARHVIHHKPMDLTDEALDEDNDSFISWKEFLRSQAIYIISSRPNKAKIPHT